MSGVEEGRVSIEKVNRSLSFSRSSGFRVGNDLSSLSVLNTELGLSLSGKAGGRSLEGMDGSEDAAEEDKSLPLSSSDARTTLARES